MISSCLSGRFGGYLSKSDEERTLKDTVADLKKRSKAPKFGDKGKEKEKNKKKPKGENGKKKKRPGSNKKPKRDLEIHEEITIKPEDLPEGSTLHRRLERIIQDVRLTLHNIKYIIEEWYTPAGEIISGSIPEGKSKGSFGISLYRFLIYFHHHCQVTQPLLWETLVELGVDISKGQVNNILTLGKDEFHLEKDELLASALKESNWIQTDDTGAPHAGKNGYCTHIGNDFFSWFGSSDSKSRTNFLRIINNAVEGNLVIDDNTLNYLKHEGFPKTLLSKLEGYLGRIFESENKWDNFLRRLKICKKNHKVATEAAMYAGAIEKGLNELITILSDDAGQFNVPLLLHALCWIHEIRHIKNLNPETEPGKKAQNKALDDIWAFYHEMKKHLGSADDKTKKSLEKEFTKIFKRKTCFPSLNDCLSRILAKQSELLLALDINGLPLHNNGSERDIREFVKRRKVSGGTRSEDGKKARDTFASLKKTCRKLDISFWDYLGDRLSNNSNIERLAAIMLSKYKDWTSSHSPPYENTA